MSGGGILRLVLGDQLSPTHSWFGSVRGDVTYLFVEAVSETDDVRHHVQKVLVFFAAMRRFASALEAGGHRVTYRRIRREAGSLVDIVRRELATGGYRRFEYQEPDSYALDVALARLSTDFEDVACVGSEHFFADRYEVQDFFAGRRTWRMEALVRHLRTKHDVLMDGDGPATGKWNLDKDNRKKWPKDREPPEPLVFSHDVRGIADELEREGIDTLGTVDASSLAWPLDRAEALALLEDFVARLLPHFGDLQDAMTTRGWSLYHSRMAQALNMKMLTPREVVRAVEAAWRAEPERLPFNAVEGFIRQVIGWREYVRGVYWARMPDYASENALGAKRPLPRWFWDGDTRMACQRHAVGQSLEYGYAHHIQRLMVTGNFALLAGIDPDEVDAWYLGIYVDALEWVQLPNTRGMSQFADGGFVGSKPYAASANYIQKQGDYCRSCEYAPKRRHGEGACPLNPLYWHFYDRHRERFEGHPRIGMAYRVWDRFDADERNATLATAERYLATLDEL